MWCWSNQITQCSSTEDSLERADHAHVPDSGITVDQLATATVTRPNLQSPTGASQNNILTWSASAPMEHCLWRWQVHGKWKMPEQVRHFPKEESKKQPVSEMIRGAEGVPGMTSWLGETHHSFRSQIAVPSVTWRDQINKLTMHALMSTSTMDKSKEQNHQKCRPGEGWNGLQENRQQVSTVVSFLDSSWAACQFPSDWQDPWKPLMKEKSDKSGGRRTWSMSWDHSLKGFHYNTLCPHGIHFCRRSHGQIKTQLFCVNSNRRV